MTLLERWKCPRCLKSFLHARYLTRHLDEAHGVCQPVSTCKG